MIFPSIIVMLKSLTLCLSFLLGYMEQNKSLRHYEWFLCEITINLHIPGYNEKICSSIEFISAFSLRSLEACVRPYNCTPRKYCSLDLRFSLLPRDIGEDFNPHFHPRCCRSYESIKEMILRNVIYVLSVETCLNHIV